MNTALGRKPAGEEEARNPRFGGVELGLTFDSEKEKEYKDLLKQYMLMGDTGLLVKALMIIPDIVREALNKIE